MPEKSVYANCNIYVIKNIDNKNIGDKNSSLGIAKSLMNKINSLNKCTSQILEYTIDQKEELEQALLSDKKSIIITAGGYGITFIESLSPNKDNFVIWSGHQIYDELNNIAGKASSIILPSYIINDHVREDFAAKNTKIIDVPGVAGNNDKSSLKNEYDKHPFLHDKEKSVIVFIGGDAPAEDGHIKQMSLEDAFNLGNNGASMALNDHAFLVATNSPRTNQAQLSEFEHGLINGGLTHDQYQIFDFHSGERVYSALLYMASIDGNDVIVTGESSSMVRDLVEQAHKPIYIYLVESMNETHKKQIEYELMEGHINLVTEEGLNCSDYEYIPPIPITEMIAQDLMKEIDCGWE